MTTNFYISQFMLVAKNKCTKENWWYNWMQEILVWNNAWGASSTSSIWFFNELARVIHSFCHFIPQSTTFKSIYQIHLPTGTNHKYFKTSFSLFTEILHIVCLKVFPCPSLSPRNCIFSQEGCKYILGVVPLNHHTFQTMFDVEKKDWVFNTKDLLKWSSRFQTSSAWTKKKWLIL